MHVFVFIIKSFPNSYFLDALFKLWRHEGLRGLYKVSLPCYVMAEKAITLHNFLNISLPPPHDYEVKIA